MADPADHSPDLLELLLDLLVLGSVRHRLCLCPARKQDRVGPVYTTQAELHVLKLQVDHSTKISGRTGNISADRDGI